MQRRDFLKLGAATAALGATGALTALPAGAQAKLVLKATDVHPLGYPTVEAVERMGKKLEAATSGRLSIQMFPSMQLGGEKEMIEQAQLGALQLARISVGPMGPLVPEFNVFNLPFVFRDGAHMEKVIDGPIGAELLDKLSKHPTAGLIGLCYMNAGIRNVDVAAASKAGVLVTQASAGFVAAVSEMVLGFLVDLSRSITRSSAAYRAGRVPPAAMGRELHGATLGIIGYGANGKEVSRIGKALGMRVLVNDPYVKDVEQSSFDTLLRESDFVVPIAVATEETENLMNAVAFGKMKKRAYFINVSRGNLVDEAALEAALDSGRLGGCAMDVGRAPDQMPTPRLAARPDVIATPHTAGLTLPAIEHQSLETVAQAAKIIKGRVPKGAVNAEHWKRKP